MTYRYLKMLTVLLPTLLIGGFEYIRHDFLLPYLSMEAGNFYITLLTLVISFFFSNWVFRTIKKMNQRLMEEQATRAVYEERERLARELHDGMAQTLFFLNVKLKQRKLEEALETVSEIDSQVRQAIFNLRSLPGQGGSFASQVLQWISQWSLLTGIEVDPEIRLPDRYFTMKDEVHLLGVIQETFTNIRKHAKAGHVKISLTASETKGWELSIRDNGIGMDTAAISERKYGLAMIKQRAELLQAQLTLQKSEQGGTVLILRSSPRGV